MSDNTKIDKAVMRGDAPESIPNAVQKITAKFLLEGITSEKLGISDADFTRLKDKISGMNYSEARDAASQFASGLPQGSREKFISYFNSLPKSSLPVDARPKS